MQTCVHKFSAAASEGVARHAVGLAATAALVGCAWVGSSLYDQVETPATPELMQALRGRVWFAASACLVRARGPSKDVLALRPDWLYRVRTPQWSGFVKLATGTTTASAKALNAVTAKDFDETSISKFPGGDATPNTLVFYVRARHKGPLEAFIRAAAAAAPVTQLAIREASRTRLLVDYIVAQYGPSRMGDFLLTLSSQGTRVVEATLKRDVDYAFTFPDGTPATATRVIPTMGYKDITKDQGDGADVLIVTLAGDKTADSAASIAAKVEGLRPTTGSRNLPVSLYVPASHYSEGWYWKRKVSCSVARPLDTLYLDPGLKATLTEDIRRFLASGCEYERLGMPHRRGYLLHGPPGTGKTSLIRAIAGAFGMGLCIMRFADLNDSGVAQLMEGVPPQSIVVMEDLDHMFSVGNTPTAPEPDDEFNQLMGIGGGGGGSGRAAAGPSAKTAPTQKSPTNVTLSGLLNAIDGLMVGKCTLVFMSTNDVAALAPSVCRPGRCDLKLYLGRMSAPQIVSMTLGFFTGMAKEAAAKFAADLVGGDRAPPTPAELQGYFLSCGGDSSRVCARDAAAFFVDNLDRR